MWYEYSYPKDSRQKFNIDIKIIILHGTIKNYRYDGDVSVSPSLIPARPRVGKW